MNGPYWKNKKILITGADGFIGSHLTQRLVNAGAQVRAFVYYNSFSSWGWLETLAKEEQERLDVFMGDVRDPNGVETAMKDVAIVFHLAALIGIPYSYHSPDSYVDTNIQGTLNILQAARKLKAKKVLHTSTSEVYGTAQYVPMDERHPIVPQSPYAATKAAADDLALSFYRSFDLPVTVVRPFNTFGPRQSARAIIPTIITQIQSGTKTIQLGNLAATRDFNYVVNLVDAFLALAQATKTDGEVFNVGTGDDISVRGLVDLVSKITGKKVRIAQEKKRFRPQKSEVERLQCRAAKIKKVCGWTPRVSLEEGLELTCRWFQDNAHRYKAEIYHV